MKYKITIEVEYDYITSEKLVKEDVEQILYDSELDFNSVKVEPINE